MRRSSGWSAIVVAPLVASLTLAQSSTFSVSSPDFGPGPPIPEGHIFNDYGCTGGNRSPALKWQGAPTGTKSFAITMFDLDEHGTPSGWWHWVVYDLPATTFRLPENAGAVGGSGLPAGAVEGRTDLGQDGYHGPCPGKGEPPHRYQITVYALSIDKLPVPAEASGVMLTWTARDYTLAKTTLTARYQR